MTRKFFQFFVFSLSLVLSNALLAQFDDVYYDPSGYETTKSKSSDYDNSSATPDHSSSVSSGSIPDAEYDDQYLDYDDEYSYTSRIRRFHRSYSGFDFYDPCYVNVYYYDPYRFDPYYYDRDIYYSYAGSYNDYRRWRRWNNWSYWNSWSYWNYWDWSFGYSPFCGGFRYSYWPSYNPWIYNRPYYGYSGCYSSWNNDWDYYGYRRYSNDHHYGREDRNNHPDGYYYGSRRGGQFNGSKRGPIRVVDTDYKPKRVIPTTDSYQPGNDSDVRPTGRRVVKVDPELPGGNGGRSDRNVNPRIDDAKPSDHVNPNEGTETPVRKRIDPKQSSNSAPKVFDSENVNPETPVRRKIEQKESSSSTPKVNQANGNKPEVQSEAPSRGRWRIRSTDTEIGKNDGQSDSQRKLNERVREQQNNVNPSNDERSRPERSRVKIERPNSGFEQNNSQRNQEESRGRFNPRRESSQENRTFSPPSNNSSSPRSNFGSGHNNNQGSSGSRRSPR
ncbi:MAG TPA: hypothetical protein PK006_11640 [Saprospiraceae bacterium]|nr:hypothetical protein [Saprospiraceae bacterium]